MYVFTQPLLCQDIFTSPVQTKLLPTQTSIPTIPSFAQVLSGNSVMLVAL